MGASALLLLALGSALLLLGKPWTALPGRPPGSTAAQALLRLATTWHGAGGLPSPCLYDARAHIAAASRTVLSTPPQAAGVGSDAAWEEAVHQAGLNLSAAREQLDVAGRPPIVLLPPLFGVQLEWQLHHKCARC
jgi:hypothetical protein